MKANCRQGFIQRSPLFDREWSELIEEPRGPFGIPRNVPFEGPYDEAITAHSELLRSAIDGGEQRFRQMDARWHEYI